MTTKDMIKIRKLN